MSDITATPESLADAYVATQNETDPAKRLAAIGRVWAGAATYRDPLMDSRKRGRVGRKVIRMLEKPAP